MIFWSAVLFVFSIFVSQSAMDLFGTLLILSVCFRVVQDRRAGKKNLFIAIGFDWIWALWLGVVALSFALSPLEGTAWLSRLFEFRWIILLYVMVWTLRDQGLKPKAQVAASILLGLLSLYAIVIWCIGYDPVKNDYEMSAWTGGRRTGGLLSNPMTFAHIYGTAFCVFAGLSLYAIHFRSRYARYLLPALVLAGLAVLLSFTRGMWIAMSVASLAMAFLFRVQLGATLTAAAAALVALATLLWPTFRERIFFFSNSGDGREWIWRAHWKIFTDHPLTGVGYGENFRMIPEYYKSIGAPADIIISHAHNQYLHFLAGTGIIGLLVYLLVLALFCRLSWRVYKGIDVEFAFHKGLALGCFGAQIAFWVGGLTEANLEHSKVKSILLVVWALVVWLGAEHGLLRSFGSMTKAAKEPK